MSGLDALASMHERDRELGVDPFSVPRVRAPAPPPPAPLNIERPDWEQEDLERRRREAAARLAAPGPPLVVEDTQTTPAPRTPRLNAVQRWRREQLRPDLGGAA
jgi:hypothetical protein